MARTILLSVIAGVFGLAMLALLHMAGWMWLEQRYGPITATLLVALADGLLTVILLLMARGGHDPVAEEALQLRRQSISLLTSPSALRPQWERLAMEVGGMIIDRMTRSRR